MAGVYHILAVTAEESPFLLCKVAVISVASAAMLCSDLIPQHSCHDEVQLGSESFVVLCLCMLWEIHHLLMYSSCLSEIDLIYLDEVHNPFPLIVVFWPGRLWHTATFFLNFLSRSTLTELAKRGI